MKPKHQRLWLLVLGLCMLGAGTLLLINIFKENLLYFYTPSELAAAAPDHRRKLRIGGQVKPGSVTRNEAHITFVITDHVAEVAVEYEGVLPSLFREGQGIIAEGTLTSPAPPFALRAGTILAKHDETYMPPGVAQKLKSSGHWHPSSDAR